MYNLLIHYLGNDKERHIPQWNNLGNKILRDQMKTGYSIDQIDTVLCTHIILIMLDRTILVNDKWEPTLKKADIYLAKRMGIY